MSVCQSILARLQTAAGVSLAESAGTGVLEIITRCTTQIEGSSVSEPATVRQILAHAGEPTTAPAIAPARSPPVEANAQQLIAPEAVEAIRELEFDQTANLTAEAGDNEWTSPVGADAEPVPELEFDQTLGW